MPSEAKRAEETPFDVSEKDIDAHLAMCGGDARETIRRLLIGQAWQERQISRGFSRSIPLARLSDLQDKNRLQP